MVLMSATQAAKLPEAMEAVSAGVEPAPAVHLIDDGENVRVIAAANGKAIREVVLTLAGEIVEGAVG